MLLSARCTLSRPSYSFGSIVRLHILKCSQFLLINIILIIIIHLLAFYKLYVRKSGRLINNCE